MSFIHLHNHSHYSILAGLPKPKEYVKKAVEYGMEAVALTDTYNIYGCHELYKEAKGAGINPILGVEICVVPNSIGDTSKENFPHKLVLLAKSLVGYQNILKLVSLSYLEGLDSLPRIDMEILKKYKEDIVVLSGPKEGEIPFYILSGKTDDEIVERIKMYQNILGKENYYLELIHHPDIPKQDLITSRLIEISKKYDIPVVATNNCYYIEKEDKMTQDVIMCLGGGYELENPDRPTLINGDYSFLSPEEMEKIWGYIPEALENTRKIARKVNIEISTGGILIPKYELPSNDKKVYDKAKEEEKKEKKLKDLDLNEWYLRYLCFKGLNWRFNFGIGEETILEMIKKVEGPSLDKKLQETLPDELKDLSTKYYTDKKKEIIEKFTLEQKEILERLEYELVVVHEMGFDGYFLIVADYINWARTEKIPVGPGRGSAAGALLAYLSGITDINPLKYGLLFERFLNPARVSMPDIDTDFSDDERDRVIDYCREKYGSEHVAQICTFGTFAARAAVKDVGRVMGVPFAEMNELAKLIPEKPGTKLKGALEDSIEFRQAYEDSRLYKRLIDTALQIEGNVRQLGVHACAVIIAPDKMTNFTALQHPPKDNTAIVTQYSAYPLEDLGLLKMDFLGLRNLTIIKRALKIIKKRKGVDLDISLIDHEDPKVFEVFAKGDTTGVFQFESAGMRKYLKELKPDCFEDIIVMVSLYRPGPMEYIPTYIARKYGQEKVEYAHESLESILSPTQGIAVYQEQIMQMVQAFAGFSLGEADILRRAIGKKKVDVLLEQKEKFIKASESLGHSRQLATDIFEKVIEPFAGYGFNKSHAACYAMIAYETAYLKAYYPTEFLVALMISDEENTDRVVLEVGECESKGIKVLPPSVNESLKHFTYIDDKTIRFGLKAIKGVGDGPVEAIKKAREEGGEFVSIDDFVKRGGRDAINKKTLEALILSGSMDMFGDRGELYKNIENIIKFSKNQEKQKDDSQIGLFEMGGIEETLELEKVEPFSYEEMLRGEKDVLGFSVSGHALDGLEKFIGMKSKNDRLFKMSMEELSKHDTSKRERAQLIGVIKEIRKTTTKTGKRMMFLSCESFHYDFEVTVFDKDYDKYKEIKEDSIVVVEGTISISIEYGRKSLQANSIKSFGISKFREIAGSEIDNSKVNRFLSMSEGEAVVSGASDSVGELENPVEEELVVEYIVNIPEIAKKDDLVELKNHLSNLEKGDKKIYISLKGEKIYTKYTIKDVGEVEVWEKERGWK